MQKADDREWRGSEIWAESNGWTQDDLHFLASLYPGTREQPVPRLIRLLRKIWVDTAIDPKTNPHDTVIAKGAVAVIDDLDVALRETVKRVYEKRLSGQRSPEPNP